MKFFEKLKISSNNNNKNDHKTVLFVCVENAGRSQIAEGFLNNMILKDLKSKVQGQNLYQK
jgi:hypothetical protein